MSILLLNQFQIIKMEDPALKARKKRRDNLLLVTEIKRSHKEKKPNRKKLRTLWLMVARLIVSTPRSSISQVSLSVSKW